MAQRIVGLDLGSYSIKAVHVMAKGRTGDFEVVQYDEALVPPPFDVEEGQPATLRERQSLALQELLEKGALKGDVFVTGLPGDGAAVRTLRFPFSDARKIEQTLPFELEAEIPFDLDDVVISWSVLRHKQGVDANETEVLAAYARRESVSELLSLLAEVGVDPRHVEFDALALDDLFDGVWQKAGPEEMGAVQSTPGGTVIETGPDAPAAAVAMVDIGHRRTSVCILEGGRVVSAQTILHGGGDATQKLAKELGLSYDDADRGKRKEAFIEVLGAVAQFPEQARVSDILKNAYGPIARRLRQVFQAAVSSQRVRVTKVILTGGGSRVLNLDRYLAEVLNVRVVRAPELEQLLGAVLSMDGGPEISLSRPEAPEAGLALGYALSGLRADKTRARIDFRTGEFAWKGELDFLRERALPLTAWAAVLVLALGFSGAVQAFVLSSEEDDIRQQQLAACKAITGQDIDSSSRCLAIIQERISGQAGFSLPEYSAVDHYLTAAKRLPPVGTLQRKVTELDVNPERMRVLAVVPDFDAVDKVVAGLEGGRCFDSLEKGKARNVNGGVEFNVVVRLDCQKAEGDGKDAEGELQEEKTSARAPAASSRRTSGSRIKQRARDLKANTAAKNEAAARAADDDKGDKTDKTDKADKGDKADKSAAAGGESKAERAREERLQKLKAKREALQHAREAAGAQGTPRPVPGQLRPELRRGPIPALSPSARTLRRDRDAIGARPSERDVEPDGKEEVK